MLTRPISQVLIAFLTLLLWFAVGPHQGWAGPLTQAGQVYLPVISGGNLPTPTPTQGAATGASPTPTPTTTTTPPSEPATATPLPPTTVPLTPTPESPYRVRLIQALAHCAGISANQACLANGAAAGFAQVGTTLDITRPVTLAVRSALTNALDLANWSVLLIRLQAPGAETITQTVDLIAVGQVDVAVHQLFTSTEVAPGVPVVGFASQPLQHDTQRAPSGLIIRNRTISELLSIEVNGAAITLDGTAFVRTQVTGTLQAAATSGETNMAVNVQTGSALVQSAGEATPALAGSQVNVPLDGQGNANGAPSTTEISDDDLLVPLDDLLVPLTPEGRAEAMRLALETAFSKCSIDRNPHQVYRASYYVRQLNTSANRGYIGQEAWNRQMEYFKKCARFEVIFDSTVNLSGPVTLLNQVHSDGTFIQFDIDGNLVARSSSPVRYLQVKSEMPVCIYTSNTAQDGTFAVEAATLKLFYNTFKISLQAFPHLEQYTATYICPAPAPPAVLTWEFNSHFVRLHPELWIPQPIYVLNNVHWKYTGRQIFAEAIFADRTAPTPAGTVHGDSYFILRHAPVE